jgi:hypothetical protein
MTIRSKAANRAYRDGWDRIFKKRPKKEEQECSSKSLSKKKTKLKSG